MDLERIVSELQQKFAAAEEQHKTLFRRIEKAEKLTDSVNELALSVRDLVNAQQTTDRKLTGLCSDVAPEHEMEKVLFAADELTGLIWAAAKMRPSQSTKDMEVSSLKKKFKDKKFAAGCSRDVITKGAEILGWELTELLEKTGGIVQGMSGSPILQDGKIVGAVTHVLVNDPTKGYGIFIEDMLRSVE